MKFPPPAVIGFFPPSMWTMCSHYVVETSNHFGNPLRLLISKGWRVFRVRRFISKRYAFCSTCQVAFHVVHILLDITACLRRCGRVASVGHNSLPAWMWTSRFILLQPQYQKVLRFWTSLTFPACVCQFFLGHYPDWHRSSGVRIRPCSWLRWYSWYSSYSLFVIRFIHRHKWLLLKPKDDENPQSRLW